MCHASRPACTGGWIGGRIAEALDSNGDRQEDAEQRPKRLVGDQQKAAAVEALDL